MQRGAPKAMQVLEIWTSAETRRTSPARSVGSLCGPSDITTRFLAHLRRAMGTVSRRSDLSPLVANSTRPAADLGASRAPAPGGPPAICDDAATAVNATPSARGRAGALQRRRVLGLPMCEV